MEYSQKAIVIEKLQSLIQFGWDFVDSEAAELYEEKIEEIIKEVEEIKEK